MNFAKTNDEFIGQPETPAVAKPTETGLTTGSVTVPNAVFKKSFDHCILNERCRGPK